MRNQPYFNFPTFFLAADKLRAEGHFVFNPAERDVSKYGERVYKCSPTGNLSEIPSDIKFSLREALGADTAFICAEADGIALLPGWEKSSGARAEKALADALGLQVITL